MIRTFVFMEKIEEVSLNAERSLEEAINQTISDFAKKRSLKEVKRTTDTALSPHGEYQDTAFMTLIVTSVFEEVNESLPKTTKSCLEGAFK